MKLSTMVVALSLIAAPAFAQDNTQQTPVQKPGQSAGQKGDAGQKGNAGQKGQAGQKAQAGQKGNQSAGECAKTSGFDPCLLLDAHGHGTKRQHDHECSRNGRTTGRHWSTRSYTRLTPMMGAFLRSEPMRRITNRRFPSSLRK